MKTKNTNPINLIKKNKISEITKIYFQLNHLKQLLRQGWLRYIPEDKCESIADHCFGTTLLALFIAEKYYPRLDKNKIVKMVLIHELGEIVVGDLTPDDEIDREEKYKLEKRAVDQLFSKFPQGKKYVEFFEELKDGKSFEARLVKQIDYLEMAFQARIYQKQYKKNLSQFITSAQKRLKDKGLKKLLEELKDI